jgi:AMMECR1 domain-containing protein
LPQVWEEISNKTEFLEQLSLKAGLSKDEWKNSQFWYYKVKAVKE